MKFWHEITTKEDIAEACEDAAEILEGHWVTGTWFSTWEDADTGEERWAYCIEGAMAAAIGLEAENMDCEAEARRDLITCPVYTAVTETLNLRAEREGIADEWFGEGDLPNWNDGTRGSEQGALDILHETAKRMRGVEP